MPTTLNKAAYQQLIDEDLAWLLSQPRTLEREHIADVLKWLRENRHQVEDVPAPAPTGIEFAPFCDPNQSRYSVESPFVRQGFEYATDGRIIIRRPSSDPDTVDRKVPRGEEIFADNPPAIEAFHPIGKQEFDGCCDCIDGTSECDLCGTTWPCGKCGGTGRYNAWIDDIGFSPKYDKLVRSLPDVQVAISANERLWFRSLDCEGVLMPLGADDSEGSAMRRVVLKESSNA